MHINVTKISNHFGSTKQTKVVTFCAIGNLLELYDYVLFAVMLSIISQKFFPAGDHDTSIILGMLTFAISFVFSAFGSIFWGWYADKYGRKKMLNLSMLIMAIPSLTIGVLPTYEEIGIISPIILIIARILQGISASGEVQGAKIYAMEVTSPETLGTTAGILSSAGGIGVMLAMFMGYIISISEYENAWRFPFLLGSFIGYIGILLRREHIKAKYEQTNTIKSFKVFDIVNIIKQYKYESYSVFALGAILGSVSYMLHAFMNPFMVNLGISNDKAYLFVIVSLLSTIIFSIISGIYSDKHNRLISIMKNNINAIAFCIIPAFLMILSKNIILSGIACFILGSLLGINATICGIIMYKSFPYEVRCRGIMFLYALSVSVFGGFTPIILKSVAMLDNIYPAYIMVIIIIAMVLLFNYSIKKIRLYG